MNTKQPAKPPRNKTPHEAAVAYSKKAWGKYSNRDAWEDALRYKGEFKLPTLIT